MMFCARGPEIFISAFIQFLGEAPHGPRDPQASSLFNRYRKKLPPSGHGSIAVALCVSVGAIPAFFIGLGLFTLTLLGALGVVFFAIPAKLQAGVSTSPLAAARSWASHMAERLAAEGSSDLAASEASLLDRSLPTPSKTVKAQRI